jgi:hypothetical protein
LEREIWKERFVESLAERELPEEIAESELLEEIC